MEKWYKGKLYKWFEKEDTTGFEKWYKNEVISFYSKAVVFYTGLIELDISVNSEYYPKYVFEGLIQLISSVTSNYISSFLFNIIINDYILPITFVWKRVPDFIFNSKSYNSGDIRYILENSPSTIEINGILEGTSKNDVESKYKTLMDKIFYDSNVPYTMSYRNRTYFVYPLQIKKERVNMFSNQLKVSANYGLKTKKETQWS